jgi:uncharacterized protein (DUF169 family)
MCIFSVDLVKKKALIVQNYKQISIDLVKILGLRSPPLAISFGEKVAPGISYFESKYPDPTADGRTGAVSAGCVFWMEAATKTFATVPSDHGNCSVGCYTHGLKNLEEVATNSDVKAICEAGWVSPESFPSIPVVKTKSKVITYGPLSEATIDPDVVLLRVIGKQVMQIQSALPALRFEGKPQCHIVALAKEDKEIAVSTGCMLSRARTRMSNNELMCALPQTRLLELLDGLTKVSASDLAVAGYAARDSQRFLQRT